MPRPRKNDSEIKETDFIKTMDFDEIEGALSELPEDDLKITVYRMNEQGRSRFIKRFSPAEFDLSTIQAEWGGGRYKFVASQSGMKVKEGIFEIEGPMYDGNPINVRDGNGRFLPKTLQTVDNGHDPLIPLLQRLIEKLDEGKKTESTLLTTLLPILLQNNASSEDKILERLSQFKNLFSSNNSPVSADAEVIFNAFDKGMKVFSQKFGGSEGGEKSAWVEVAERFLPTIMSLLQRFQPLPAPGPTQNFQPPPQAAQQNGQAKIEQPKENGIMEALKPYLPIAINAASLNQDPEPLADYVVPVLVNMGQKEEFRKWLEGETWFKEIVQHIPAVALQAQWWHDFRDAILAALKEGEEKPDESV